MKEKLIRSLSIIQALWNSYFKKINNGALPALISIHVPGRLFENNVH